MNIIIARADGRRAHSMRLTRRHKIAAAGGTVMLCVGLLAAGIALGRVFQPSISQVPPEPKEVAALRASAEANLDALGRRLGELQARALRLEAISQAIANAGKLDLDDFDLASMPAQGGAGGSAADSWRYADMDQALAALDSDMGLQEKQLDILQRMQRLRSTSERLTPTGRPIDSGWLSSNYGRRTDPFTGKPDWHAGLDFAGHEGSPVRAVADGVVSYADDRYGYGLLVEVTHGDGLSTRYAHLKRIDVEVGQTISGGEQVGQMGSTGRSTGPHVHFEVLRDGKQLNPLQFVRRDRQAGL